MYKKIRSNHGFWRVFHILGDGIKQKIRIETMLECRGSISRVPYGGYLTPGMEMPGMDWDDGLDLAESKHSTFYACIYANLYGWMDGWMDGRMDGWMDG